MHLLLLFSFPCTPLLVTAFCNIGLLVVSRELVQGRLPVQVRPRHTRTEVFDEAGRQLACFFMVVAFPLENDFLPPFVVNSNFEGSEFIEIRLCSEQTAEPTANTWTLLQPPCQPLSQQWWLSCRLSSDPRLLSVHPLCIQGGRQQPMPSLLLADEQCRPIPNFMLAGPLKNQTLSLWQASGSSVSKDCVPLAPSLPAPPLQYTSPGRS